MKQLLFIFLAALALTACSDNSSKKSTESTAKNRADNQLLKMQDDTTKKAQDAVNQVLEKQQNALNNVDK